MSGSEPDLDALLRALRAARRGDLHARLDGDSDVAREWNAFMAECQRLTGEVTRVAAEIADEGRFGGKVVLGYSPAGTWAAVADGINALAGILTLQVRNLTDHARAVARGDVSKRFTLPARGEIDELKQIVNTMTDMLAAFGDDVARTARQLQAAGPEAEASPIDDARAGLWRVLTDNVTRSEQIAVASRYKSEFLANMSHELRTPLNSMLILSRLLVENPDGNLTARQVEYARTIHGAGNDLLDLINDILDLSKIEAGKMPVQIRRVAVAEIAHLLERDFRPLADHRGLELLIETAPDAPVDVPTDPQRLHQVLKNLLANAFKFTSSGAVRVTVASDHGEHVRFAVSDTGIGISEDKLDLIFEPFQQASAGTARKYGGTGLGLSISRGFAHLLGGNLTATSTPGLGSTFTLSLPTTSAVPLPLAPPTPTPAPSPSRPLVRRSELAGRRVLVVDDDIRNIFALVSLLESQAVSLSFTQHGADALTQLATRPFDLVLMDMMMPDLDGYEVLRRVRLDPNLAALPIIAVTARALSGDLERCLAAGATAYLAKPVDADRLLALMSDLLT